MIAGLLSGLLGMWAAAASATSVTYVGQNPFSSFPSTGGTGSIASQSAGSATLEKAFTSLGDVPFIVDGGPSAGTQTLHIDERVRNESGVAWSDFHLTFQSIDASPDLLVEFLNVSNPSGEFGSIVASPGGLSLVGAVADGGTFSLSFDLRITTGPAASSCSASTRRRASRSPRCWRWWDARCSRWGCDARAVTSATSPARSSRPARSRARCGPGSA